MRIIAGVDEMQNRKRMANKNDWQEKIDRKRGVQGMETRRCDQNMNKKQDRGETTATVL